MRHFFAGGMSSSSDSIAVEETHAPPLAQRVRRARPKSLDGPLRIWLLVACADGLLQGLQGDAPETWQQAGRAGVIVGTLLATAWAMVSADHEPERGGVGFQRRQAASASRSHVCRGCVEYPIHASVMLLEPLVAP